MTPDTVPTKIIKRPKKSKRPINNDDPSPSKKQKKSKSDSGDSDNEIREPTRAELIECMKPENTADIQTVRQKKKKNHQNIVEVKKISSEQRERDNIKTYIQTWKTNREAWKFEKLRQIAIQKHLFDVDQISEDIWETVVEYMAGTKGAARLSIIKSAEELINQIDEDEDAEDSIRKILLKNKYKRAREILQILQ